MMHGTRNVSYCIQNGKTSTVASDLKECPKDSQYSSEIPCAFPQPLQENVLTNYVITTYNYSQTYDVPSEVVCSPVPNYSAKRSNSYARSWRFLSYWTPITGRPRSTIFFGTRKQTFREEVKEPEPYSKVRTATVWSWLHGVIQAGSYEQRAARSRHGTVSILAWYTEI
jgi:hypothetical protein